MVLAHVDQLGGPLHALKRRLDHRFGFADEGHDRAVGRLARIDIQKFHSIDRLDRIGDLPDDGLVASLAKVGNALYDSFFHIRGLI